MSDILFFISIAVLLLVHTYIMIIVGKFYERREWNKLVNEGVITVHSLKKHFEDKGDGV